MTVDSPGGGNPMRYDLRLDTTASGIGYFSCIPAVEAGFDDSLAYLRSHPNDEFMHKFLLERVTALDAETLGELIALARPSDPIFLAILLEAVLTHEKFETLRDRFSSEEAQRLSELTPLVYIRSSLLPDQSLHREWIRILEPAFSEHASLPSPETTGLPFPFSEDTLSACGKEVVHVSGVFREIIEKGAHPKEDVPNAGEVARKSLERLNALGLIAGPETRHTSSLSPHGFFRKWRLDLSVRIGRHDYTLSGLQTSWGKGLREADARASYVMEMVERVSSFSSFDARGPTGYIAGHALRRARYGEIAAETTPVLDPNNLGLEVPYRDEPLYWLEAQRATLSGLEPVLIPAQMVFLFCNLDEIALFSGLGSTGLASGNTVEQAKVSGLLEALERAAEAVTPYDPARCFRIEAEDALTASILSAYSAKGIELQFQDMTLEYGVPCYKCFVVGRHSQVVKGTGANLNGWKALVSAMTETPYPYPDGPPSRPAPEGLPAVRLEELPSYSTGSSPRDLELLENLLIRNGHAPIYADLTREDLRIPVVRTIVPGFELIADFDRFSRVGPRLFANYLKVVRGR